MRNMFVSFSPTSLRLNGKTEANVILFNCLSTPAQFEGSSLSFRGEGESGEVEFYILFLCYNLANFFA